MIAPPVELAFLGPCGIPKQYRNAVRARSGEWVITTWDWDFDHSEVGCFGRTLGAIRAKMCGNAKGCTLQKTELVLKEAEVPRLMHQLMHGIRNKTKPESIQANLEQTAQTLWPSGSLEHVALRFLAVPLMMRVCYGHYVHDRRSLFGRYIVAPIVGCILSEHKGYYRTQLLRLSDSSSGALNHYKCEANNATFKFDEGTNSRDKGDGSSKYPEEPDIDEAPDTEDRGRSPKMDAKSASGHKRKERTRDVSPLHGGTTPKDADILASVHNRVVDLKGIKLVVGQDFDGTDNDNKQFVGVLTSPTPVKPNVPNNSSKNAEAAKRERLLKKARPFKANKAQKRKIKKFVAEATGTKHNRAIFSVKRIQRWAENFFHLQDIKSGKWTLKRLEDSLNNLMKEAYPKMNLKCSVKLEPMPEGKAPRLLIADGDDGQLMAMVVVRCFEDLLFEWFEDKSIKHLPKRRAIHRCVNMLTKKGAKLIEGDGSAWDTTCNAMIRALVENPILKHIMQTLIPYGVVPQQWHEEHMNCCEKKKLKLFFQKKWDKLRIQIDAIRRSGHRGTSCLNWWMNFTNWACSIFKQPERFLDPTVRKGIDETGHERWWFGVFEGDDSLCSLYPPMKKDDDMNDYFLQWWKDMGFNMEIVYAKDRATFCGYHISCDEGEVGENTFVCPELPRALKNAGVSCSPNIIAAAEKGDVKTVRDIAAASALARAADFAGLLPSVSRKFHDYARSVKYSRDVVDREMSMRVMGEEGHNFSALEETIEEQNLAVTPTEERRNLKALKCGVSAEELETFVLHPWTFESVGDHDGFLASLPKSWRPASS